VYNGVVEFIPHDVKDKIQETMTLLDSFVAKSFWFAGDNVTLADLSILPNVSQIKVIFCYNSKVDVNEVSVNILGLWLQHFAAC
jgi:glutathione S-transferase